MVKIRIVNGPNLGRLGVRDPEVYGNQSIAMLQDNCEQWAKELGAEIEFLQTDDEAQMIRWMHEAVDAHTAVIMNPGAFTHYSYALADAASQVTDAAIPLIEVHISNPAAREEFRKRSVISPIATGTIAGFGFWSYNLAMRMICELSNVQ